MRPTKCKDAGEGLPKSLSPRIEGERRMAPMRNSRGMVLTSSVTCSLLESHSTSPPSSSTSPSFPPSSSPSSSSSSASTFSHSSAPLVSPRSTSPIPIVPRISLPANFASSSSYAPSSSSTMSSSPPTSSSVTSNWSNPRIKHRTASVASFHEAGISLPSLPMQSPRLMALNSHRSPSVALGSRSVSQANIKPEPVSQERVRAAVVRALQSPEAKKIALTLIQNEINKRIIAPKDLSSLLIPNSQENLSLSPLHLVQAFQERLAVDARSWVPPPDPHSTPQQQQQQSSLSETQKPSERKDTDENDNDEENDIDSLRIEPPSPELLLLRQILCDHRVQQTSLPDTEGVVFGWPETIELFELELVPEHDESFDPLLSDHPDRPLSTFLVEISSILDLPQLSLFLRKVNFFYQHHYQQTQEQHDHLLNQQNPDGDLIDLSEVTESPSSFVEQPFPSLMYVCRSASADAKRIAIAQSIHIVHYD